MRIQSQINIKMDWKWDKDMRWNKARFIGLYVFYQKLINSKGRSTTKIDILIGILSKFSKSRWNLLVTVARVIDIAHNIAVLLTSYKTHKIISGDKAHIPLLTFLVLKLNSSHYMLTGKKKKQSRKIYS